MIIKKILILFCLIPIALNSYGMEDKLPNGSQRQLTNLRESSYNSYSKYLDKLIQVKDETQIISFLAEHSNFVEAYLSVILSKLSHAKLYQAVDHILQTELIIIDADRDKLIEIALALDDIDRVKALTRFDSYLDRSNRFSLNEYIDSLTNARLDGRAIFNKIFFYDKKNYIDHRGFRCFYLMLLDLRENFKEIIEFINTAPIDELNVQDINGCTPLMQANWLWENYKTKFNHLKKQQKAIIKALLRRKVNIEIENNQDQIFKNSTFFKTYAKKCKRWQMEQIQPSKPIITSPHIPKINSLQKLPRKRTTHVGLKIAAGVGASIVATAALYLCYKLLNKNRINSSKFALK